MQEFTPELVAKWRDLRGSMKPGITVNEFIRGDARDTDLDIMALGTLMRAEKRILSGSLQAFARRDPKQFLDKFYMVAQVGLDPDDELGKTHILELLDDCLISEPESGCIIGVCLLSSEDGTRTKAIDIDTTFRMLGIPTSHLGRKGILVDQIPETRQDEIKRLCAPFLILDNTLSGTPKQVAEARELLAQHMNELAWGDRSAEQEAPTKTLYDRLILPFREAPESTVEPSGTQQEPQHS